jgi:hypothetical protein
MVRCVVNVIRRLLLCGCGHERSAHRHYRGGSDCALCDCPRWSAASAWRPKRR